MPGFDAIVGQERPIRILTAILRSGNTPHALLFTGLKGVGKATTARIFAMALNCPIQETSKNSGGDWWGPCTECRTCRKIQTGNHPDILEVKPSGAFIRVEQIRDLVRSLCLKPYEAKRRVVIIPNAEAMNPSAANALLKVLEEPPELTVLILCAPQGRDLLPTIVSRCQQIRFGPAPPESLKRHLEEKAGLSGEDAAVLARLAGGSFSKADSLSRADWIGRRRWLIEGVNRICGLDQEGGQGSIPVGVMLAFAEQLSKNKDRLDESLDILKSWFRDLILWKYDPARVTNDDLVETIRGASNKRSIPKLLRVMEAIGEAQQKIQGNANLRLTLEMLIFRIARP